MHSLTADVSDWQESDAPARYVAAPAPVIAAPAVIADYHRERAWSDGKRSPINWPAATFVLLFHAILLTALVQLDIVQMPRTAPKSTIVDLIELPTEPPPETMPPEMKVEPVETIAPAIVAPPPIVRTPAPPPPVLTTPEPPPVRAAIVAPPRAAPAPPGPVSAVDLSTTMISAKPPKYPVESRRKREQGTVVLRVLVSLTGGVSEISVTGSSGFARLDKAALDAVRRWRWSPTVRGGEPVMVRGIVEIPFVLQG